ncbi:MAG: oligosaccharide flippase family protein [Candidatus Pacebacteria bacterium]|nr:oligosaccharide flippase family protein [Candidatus Paceibacterota bacterium]
MINQTAPDTTDDLEEALAGHEELSAEEVAAIKQKSISGVFSYFLRTAILQGIGLVSAFLLSAFFNPEDFGVYGYVTQIIGLLVFFSDVGLAASLVQKKDDPTLKDYRTAFSVQQFLSWLIVVITLVIAQTPLVASKVGVEGKWVLLALAISFPLASLKTIPSIKLERKLEFSKLVMPQVFEQLVFYSVLIFLAWRGMGAMAYSWAILLRSIIGVVVMWLIQSWQIGLAFSKTSFKELISFGAKFQLNDFLARIKDQLFFLFLGNFLPLRQFGYIQWSKTWSMYPYNLTVQNVMAITFPTFSRLQKHKNLLKKAIEKSIFFISLLIFPLLVGMAVFIKPLTQVIPQYSQWEPAVPSFVMFTLSIGWAALSTPLNNTLNAIGKINQTLKLMVLWTSLTWVLTPILLVLFGFNGVALASLLISFTSGLSIYFVKKEVPVQVWVNVKHQLLAAALMTAVGLGFSRVWSQSISWLVVGGAAASLSYALSILITARQKLFSEIQSVRQK